MSGRAGFIGIIILLVLLLFGIFWRGSCSGTCWIVAGRHYDQCIANGGTSDACRKEEQKAEQNCWLNHSACQ